MKKIVLALTTLALALLLAACGGPDASCDVCGQSYSDQECDQLGRAQGCTSGESQASTGCSTPTRGCLFHGCPTGQEIMCTVPNTDAGNPG